MKRKFKIITLLIFSMILFGCMKIDNGTISNDIDKSDTTVTVDDNDHDKNSQDKKDNEKPNNNDGISQQKIELLKKIKEEAQIGKVINCKFNAKDNILDDVRAEFGKEDKLDNIEAAKGLYATYSKNGVVFGANKGEAIFEVRSYSKEINTISFKDIKEVFGVPQYDVNTDNNERIIGYVVNDDFKIEFVLTNINGSEASQTVDHYGVLYPKGTVNLMSGDPGRQW